jgi:CRISPR-associated protein Cas1
VVIIDHPQITFTHTILAKLLENNAAFISCDDTHHPIGLMLPLSVNHTQTEKFRAQIEASEPLKKQLWQQTVIAKIKNQQYVLALHGKEDAAAWLKSFLKEVKSGDTENHEARAAALYWSNLFVGLKGFKEEVFKRERFGLPPNNLLNYGYAILRAIVARQLVASGMLPTFGIFHRNKYNAYCLADDIMEPYRPYVDRLVVELILQGLPYEELTKEMKEKLLRIPDLEVVIDGEKTKLMVALQRTTSSLMKCFEGEGKKVVYPEM